MLIANKIAIGDNIPAHIFLDNIIGPHSNKKDFEPVDDNDPIPNHINP